jgi:peptide/nickel transport system permease protein
MSVGVDIPGGPVLHAPDVFEGTPVDDAPRRFAILRRLVRHPAGVTGLSIVLGMMLLAALAPVVSPYGPNAQDALLPLQSPAWGHLLGTDDLGRDILTRIIFGTRNAAYVGLVAVSLGAAVGVSLGLVCGYFGGWLDMIVSRVADTLLAFPGIIIAIVVVAVAGAGTRQVAFAVALVNAPEFYRIMRASVLGQKSRDYVSATECIGAGNARIMFRHLMPNSVGPLFVQVPLSAGLAIRLAAGLSFIGLGSQPPEAAWGTMLKDSFALLPLGWWYAVFPGIALAIFLIGLNLLSDGLRDVYDPRSEFGQ